MPNDESEIDKDIDDDDEYVIPFDESDSAWKPGQATPPYVHRIAVETRQTANRVVQILVWAYVLSFPACVGAVIAIEMILGSPNPTEPSARTLLFQFFDRWFTGAIAAVSAAVAFYYTKGRSQDSGG